MAARIDFYFDFISPFSYLALQRLPQIANRVGREIAFHVVDLAALKTAAGNTAPPTREMPVKLRYMKADQRRWARRYGVPISSPAHYDSRVLNRGVFFAAAHAVVLDYVSLVFQKVWGEGAHMTDPAFIAIIARTFGWDPDGFADFASSATTDELYRSSTVEAARRGIFGVPTMMVGETMWWGNDRLDFLEEELAAAAAPGA